MDKAETRELALELWHALQDVCATSKAVAIFDEACEVCTCDECGLDIEDVMLNPEILRQELAAKLQRSHFAPRS